MMRSADAVFGQFCWADLAASDARAAEAFYAGLFGWSCATEHVLGGRYTRLSLAGELLGSLYQLGAKDLAGGAVSHWTPYVRVRDPDETARRAQALGGQIAVRPFDVPGAARVALILDAVGAPLGLWGPLEPSS